MYVRVTIKQFPEVFTLPLAWVMLVITREILSSDPEANAIIPFDWIQFPMIATAIVMFFNSLAHGAIKYNQPEIWKQYTHWIEFGGQEPDGYFRYLVVYISTFVAVFYILM